MSQLYSDHSIMMVLQTIINTARLESPQMYIFKWIIIYSKCALITNIIEVCFYSKKGETNMFMILNVLKQNFAQRFKTDLVSHSHIYPIVSPVFPPVHPPLSPCVPQVGEELKGKTEKVRELEDSLVSSKRTTKDMEERIAELVCLSFNDIIIMYSKPAFVSFPQLLPKLK